jgi:hypothetical protein
MKPVAVAVTATATVTAVAVVATVDRNTPGSGGCC